MQIVKPGYEVISKIDANEILKVLELVGRTCYKSEDHITDESALGFVEMITKNGHEAMIEHYSISVRIICDRGVSHEIVRHRLASYAQESTRYCNYSKDKFGNELTFILPNWFKKDIAGQHIVAWDNYDNCSCEVPYMDRDELCWFWAMALAERYYFKLLDFGWKAQQARSVLPNSLKTEIVATMNIREWRHFFKMRTAMAAHPQMREIAVPLLKHFQSEIPVLFSDLGSDL